MRPIPTGTGSYASQILHIAMKNSSYWTRFGRQMRSLTKKNYYVLLNSKVAMISLILLPCLLPFLRTHA